MKVTTAAVILGIVFIGVGLLGYTANPIISESETAIFHTDQVHNIVHISSGVLFLLFALALPAYTAFFLKLFGIIYFLLGVMGMIKFGTSGMGELLGFLHVNGADNYLHIGLGIVIFLAGTLSPRIKPA